MHVANKNQLGKLGWRVSTLCVSVVLAMAFMGSLPVTPVVQAASAPTYGYTKFAGLAGFGDASALGVATDASGNSFIGGMFVRTVIFDGPGGSDSVTSANTSGFITKRASDGTYAWTKTLDASAGYAEIRGVVTDASGNVYAAGYFYDTVTFDGPGGSDSVTSAATPNIFLTKYSGSGTYVWTKTFGTASNPSVEQKGLAIDASGNLYLTGYFNGTVVFDGPGGTDSFTESNLNMYVTKYNANGTYGWTRHFDTTTSGSVQARAVAADSGGNIYVVGSVDGDVIFSGSDENINTNIASFLVKYNTSGTYQWARVFDLAGGGSGGYADANGVAVDENDNPYFVGYFGGDVTFDGPGGSDTATAQSFADAYITTYSPSGVYGWTKYVDDTNGTATAAGVTTDKAGHVYIAGGFRGDVVFDGVGGSDTQSDQSADVFDDAFLTEWDTDGTYGWTHSFDTTNGIAGGYAVAVDSNQDVFLAGYAADTVTFDGPGGSDSHTITGGFRTPTLTKFLTGLGSGGGGSGGDTDSDGIPDAVEAAGPNGGDANNDGVADSTQNNVASFLNSVANVYEVLAVSPCQLTATTSVVAEISNAVQDSGYNYPFGLTNFRLSCTSPGASTQFTLYVYDQAGSGFVVRKYYPTSSAYSTVTAATIGQRTIAGHNVLTASYQLTDGGALDTDGVVDGIIIDPAGLAVPVVGVPNTGLGGRR